MIADFRTTKMSFKSYGTKIHYFDRQTRIRVTTVRRTGPARANADPAGPTKSCGDPMYDPSNCSLIDTSTRTPFGVGTYVKLKRAWLNFKCFSNEYKFRQCKQHHGQLKFSNVSVCWLALLLYMK